MLDEPSAGLSPVLVDRVLNVISRLRAQGTAVLLVEHCWRRRSPPPIASTRWCRAYRAAGADQRGKSAATARTRLFRTSRAGVCRRPDGATIVRNIQVTPSWIRDIQRGADRHLVEIGNQQIYPDQPGPCHRYRHVFNSPRRRCQAVGFLAYRLDPVLGIEQHDVDALDVERTRLNVHHADRDRHRPGRAGLTSRLAIPAFRARETGCRWTAP